MPMEKRLGTPDAGNPHVRCDEGEGATNLVAPLYSTAFARNKKGCAYVELTE